MSGCIFCKIVEGTIPCHKVTETAMSLAFMDINPLSRGHMLVIPKAHAEFLHELDDAVAADVGALTAKMARLVAGDGKTPRAYNILQNNGRLAHQEVPHVHFHVIPKTGATDGLGIRWDKLPTDHEAFAKDAEKYRSELAGL